MEINIRAEQPVKLQREKERSAGTLTKLETRHSPAANAEDGPNSYELRLLLALPHQEHDVEEAGIAYGVLLVVHEHAREVLCQLVVVLELVSNRV